VAARAVSRAGRTQGFGLSRPNKPKQNQINPSKIAWISLDFFRRIRTFQRVTVKPNKKIFSRLGCAQNPSKAFPLILPDATATAVRYVPSKAYTNIF
jgi:hypothetical protein